MGIFPIYNLSNGNLSCFPFCSNTKEKKKEKHKKRKTHNTYGHNPITKKKKAKKKQLCKIFHDRSTLLRSTKLTREGFKLLSSGFRTAALPFELSNQLGTVCSFNPF